MTPAKCLVLLAETFGQRSMKSQRKKSRPRKMVSSLIQHWIWDGLVQIRLQDIQLIPAKILGHPVLLQDWHVHEIQMTRSQLFFGLSQRFGNRLLMEGICRTKTESQLQIGELLIIYDICFGRRLQSFSCILAWKYRDIFSLGGPGTSSKDQRESEEFCVLGFPQFSSWWKQKDYQEKSNRLFGHQFTVNSLYMRKSWNNNRYLIRYLSDFANISTTSLELPGKVYARPRTDQNSWRNGTLFLLAIDIPYYEDDLSGWFRFLRIPESSPGSFWAHHEATYRWWAVKVLTGCPTAQW